MSTARKSRVPRTGCPNCKPCVQFRTLRCCRRRGYSSAGRARAWHARGQRFDPAYLHQIFKDFFKSQRQLDGPAALFVLRSASSRSSRGLGHDPFTVGTGVRIPYGTPFSDKRPPQPVFFFALKKIKPLKIKEFFKKLISGRLRPSRPSKSLLVAAEGAPRAPTVRHDAHRVPLALEAHRNRTRLALDL
jgi:hypothetical protein